MDYFELSNGVKLPKVAFGTWLATKEKGAQNIIDALDNGYRYIDTAAYYENEDEIGEAIEKTGINRSELFIASKVWRTDLGYESTKKSFHESLGRLKTDYLDLFLIHWPRADMTSPDWKVKIQDTWRAMEELYNEGRIRSIGLSNFMPHHIMTLMETAKIRPMVNQLELHVGYMQPVAVEYCKKNDILVQAWSPLGRGDILGDERILSVAKKYNKPIAQFLLTFLVQQGIAVVVKSSSADRMRINQDVSSFTISQEDMYYLMCLPQIGWSTEHPDMVEG